MRVLSMIAGALGGFLVAPSASADTPIQPPMNSFGLGLLQLRPGVRSFQMSYDSDTPTAATMTTNDNNKTYELKRTDSPTGVTFAAGPTKFWTDGKTVQVQGTSQSMINCKLKPT